MSQLSDKFVSIIIPVFNDSEKLTICLEALENQTYPKSLYEVIVVDNGSDEDIKSVVDKFGQAFATYESHPGSYAARNKGLSIAKGYIIGFTDADSIPSQDWIEKGVANLLQVPNCGLVAGKIALFFKNPEQPTAVEYYESNMLSFSQRQSVEESKFGLTANLFTFRSVIEQVGYFDHTLKSAGDLDWGQRVFSAGYKQIYADDVLVAHPARESLEQLRKRVIRIIGGQQDLKKKKGYYFGDFLIDFTKSLLPPLRAYRRILLDKNLKGGKQKIKYTLIFLYLKYLIAWEKLRIQLGGISRRG